MYSAVRQSSGHSALSTRDRDRDSTSPPIARHTYKPPAVRFICLSLFLAIFAACVGLIEWILADTISAQPAVSDSSSATVSLNARELTTMTILDTTGTCADLSYSTNYCPYDEYYFTSQYYAVYNAWDSMCSVFYSTFGYYLDYPLPDELQSPFTEWANSYTALQDYNTELTDAWSACYYPPDQLCSDVYFMYNGRHKLYTVTVGCMAETLTLQPPCWGVGGYGVVSGILTSTQVLVCGAIQASQMIITTDIVRTTSTTPKPTQNVVIVTVTRTATLPADDADGKLRVIDAQTGTEPTVTAPSELVVTSTVVAMATSDLEIVSLDSTSSSSNDESGAASTVVVVAVETVSEITVAATETPTTTATTGDSTIPFSLSKNEVIVERLFTGWTYFAAVFLPALIAVVIKALWEIIATSLKLIEPFQRLLESNGADARYSILTQYLEGMISSDIPRALSRGRMVPICAVLIYIMVEISPLIAAVSMTVKPRKMCLDYDNSYKPCDPAWIINTPLIRVLESLFVICIPLVMCLMWLTRRSRIPVMTNPSSIASLASLLNHGPLLRKLQKIDPDADTRLLRADLKDRTFRMAEHHDPKLNITRFGFVTGSQDLLSEKERPVSWLPMSENGLESTAAYTPINGVSQHSRHKKVLHDFKHKSYAYTRTLAFLQLLTTATLLALILTYWLDPNLNDSYNRFFNGQSVPAIVPKIILIGLAVLIDMQMKHLERIVRITDPFRRLAARNARPETTLLLPLNGTCWSNLPKNVYLLFRYEFSQGRMLWVTLVGFTACVSDLNIIAVAGLLWNIAQPPQTYLVCGYMSMACTSLMLAIILVTVVWWLNVSVIRRMPRRPDTIGSILSYLCGSEMVASWNRTTFSGFPIEDMSIEERTALIKGNGQRYCFGRMLGVDDRERWCIDYERDQGAVMIVNDQENTFARDVGVAEHGHYERELRLPKMIKRKPLSIHTRETISESGTSLMGDGSVHRQDSDFMGRFPSLRMSPEQRQQRFDSY